MKVHHQEVSCRIQALWYNVVSRYILYYSETVSVCYTIMYIRSCYLLPLYDATRQCVTGPHFLWASHPYC